MMTPLSIGIPYRDEGQDFALLAGGLRAALDALPTSLPVELLLCVNGSPDGFSEQLMAAVLETGLASVARVITSTEGKLNAMRAIVGARSLHGYIAFVDSDVVLEKNVLRLLWETLERDSNCHITYGQPVAVFPAKPNLLHHLLRVHYSLREHAYHRPYFHGRTFMLREWFFDHPGPLQGVAGKTVARLRLEHGPLVDDVAMSRMAVARWGADAIREVQSANVFFDPPDSIRGLYAGALRVAIEVERLNLLYPHHAHIQDLLFRNTWRANALDRFSLRLRITHAAYRLLDAVVKCAARLHVRAVKAGLLRVNTLWIRVPGTKRFARHRRAWAIFKKLSSAPIRKH